MDAETPGSRIRVKRDLTRISPAELARLVDLNELAISRIEAGTMDIAIIGRERLRKIAAQLETTVEYILYGELQSDRLTREEIIKMRNEGVVSSDEELTRITELAYGSIRQRNNANIPLTRVELVALLEVIRGSDGYQSKQR